jgi:hypothetical protein
MKPDVTKPFFLCKGDIFPFFAIKLGYFISYALFCDETNMYSSLTTNRGKRRKKQRLVESTPSLISYLQRIDCRLINYN